MEGITVGLIDGSLEGDADGSLVVGALEVGAFVVGAFVVGAFVVGAFVGALVAGQGALTPSLVWVNGPFHLFTKFGHFCIENVEGVVESLSRKPTSVDVRPNAGPFVPIKVPS